MSYVEMYLFIIQHTEKGPNSQHRQLNIVNVSVRTLYVHHTLW